MTKQTTPFTTIRKSTLAAIIATGLSGAVFSQGASATVIKGESDGYALGVDLSVVSGLVSANITLPSGANGTAPTAYDNAKSVLNADISATAGINAVLEKAGEVDVFSLTQPLNSLGLPLVNELTKTVTGKVDAIVGKLDVNLVALGDAKLDAEGRHRIHCCLALQVQTLMVRLVIKKHLVLLK